MNLRVVNLAKGHWRLPPFSYAFHSAQKFGSAVFEGSEMRG